MMLRNFGSSGVSCLFSLLSSLFWYLRVLLFLFPSSVLFLLLGPGFGWIVLSLISIIHITCLISQVVLTHLTELTKLTNTKALNVWGSLSRHVFKEEGRSATSCPLRCQKTPGWSPACTVLRQVLSPGLHWNLCHARGRVPACT